jgi:type I restriction enzyme S subunit
MGSDIYPLRPLVELVDIYDSMRVPVKKADRKPGPYPYYGASGIADYVDSYIFDGEYLLLAEDGENLNTQNTPIAFRASGRFWVNNHAHILQANESSNTRFLCYALQIADVNSYLSGSTRPKLTQGDMKRIPVFAPEKLMQCAIAHVLGSLDDRIELNRQMNETLETMAQALFKSWFVDFDPVIDNALASGKEIPAELSERAAVRAALGYKRQPLPAEIRTLFPDEFTFSDQFGWIPKGWECRQWGEIAKLEYGKSLKGYRDGKGTIPVFGTNGAIGFTDKALCNNDGIVIGRKGAYRGVHYSSVPFYVIDTAFYLSPIMRLSKKWAYYEILRFDINGMDSGSAIPSTSRDDFYSLWSTLPSPAVQDEFDNIVTTLYGNNASNISSNTTLSSLRDILLPKLLSGEVRIPEAEKMVEELAL